MTANNDMYLKISEDCKAVCSLLNYSSDSNGNIALKIVSKRKLLHTAQSVNGFEMDEQLLKTPDWETIDKAVKNILI